MELLVKLLTLFSYRIGIVVFFICKNVLHMGLRNLCLLYVLQNFSKTETMFIFHMIVFLPIHTVLGPEWALKKYVLKG